ncbi:2OG-Fe(II) oxygenase family protein [Candidatus Pelagibacter sp.]|nr:2OG-Fe(II) oxygenase family protein [Candidatus Pelagibacter sp.]
MSEKNELKVIKPFGPTIARVKMSNELIKVLNDYVDKTISDKNKIKDLDHGNNLAGNVTQEFKLEKKFIEESGYKNFLSETVHEWLKISGYKEIKEFEIISSWIVRQFKNEYNPVHWHGGHVSGVGYLKVPESFGETAQPLSKKNNKNGNLELIYGSRQFLSDSSFLIKPETGYYYFFPHYMMHTVYPFTGTNEERRSISFNATIDEKSFYVYGN